MSPKSICLASVILIVGLTASPVLAELIAYFPFEEGTGTMTVDATGNGNDGTLTGDVQWVPGYQGSGVNFDTAGEKILIGSLDPTDGTEAMTLAAWINWEGLGHSIGQQGIIGKRLGWDPYTTVKWFWQTNPSGDLIFRVGGQGLWWNNAILAPYEGEWTHVAMTWDNGDALQYINAEEVSAGNISFRDTANATQVTIGCVGEGNSETFVGTIDEARIYNHVLSAEDLTKAMTGDVISAFAPKPPDGATDVYRDTILTWAPGEMAGSHNVYFGLSREDVDAADAGNTENVVSSLGQDANSLAIDRLELGKTYYWRVDEVNASPDKTVFKGSVWSFEAEPYSIQIPGSDIVATASSSSNEYSLPDKTIDGSGLDENDTHTIDTEAMWFTVTNDMEPWIQYEFDEVKKLDSMKVWNSNSSAEGFIGYGVKGVQIAYSLDGETWDVFEDVNELSRASGSQTYDQYDAINLGGIAAKMIRLNILSNWGGFMKAYSLSEVQFAMIPVKVRTPVPASGTADVSPNAVISWRPGRDVDQHVIYFSTDANAVMDGSSDSIISNTSSLDLASLDLSLGRTYYWRVDEVNETEATTTWAGPVWNFSTLAAIVVEDFESYNNVSPNRPFQTWLDGIGYSSDEFFTVGYGGNGTGSAVGHDIWNGTSPHYNGSIMETDNVRGGRQSMPLYYDNTGAVASQIDRHWSTPQDWSQNGIKTLVVNFHGDPNNTGTSVYVKINGKKVIYPDNADLKQPIWHFWSIDLASLGTNLAAISSMSIGVEGAGSGMILLDDIVLYREGPSLIAAWYSLENHTNDITGNGHDGTAMGNPTYVAGAEGMGMSFVDEGNYIDVGTYNPSDGTGQLSVSFWAQWNGVTGNYQGLIGKRDSWSADDMMWQIETNNGDGNISFKQTDSNPGSGNPVLPVGEWTHLGVSYNGTTAQFYVNGAETGSGAFVFGTDTQSALVIGAVQGGGGSPFNGALDEVKLYNRPLSAGEMSVLAGLE